MHTRNAAFTGEFSNILVNVSVIRRCPLQNDVPIPLLGTVHLTAATMIPQFKKKTNRSYYDTSIKKKLTAATIIHSKLDFFMHDPAR